MIVYGKMAGVTWIVYAFIVAIVGFLGAMIYNSILLAIPFIIVIYFMVRHGIRIIRRSER